jgi:hypothetical protein
MKYANEVLEKVRTSRAATKRKIPTLVSRAKHAINPSKHEAFSIFTAEALASFYRS